jgi:hypothetical protein
LATAQAIESSTAPNKIYQRLLTYESIRQTFRKIRFAITVGKAGVTMIEAKDDMGLWQVVTEKTAIEKHCIQENIERFTQAKGAPTMQEDQINLLGWQADTNTAQQILDGTLSTDPNIHPSIIDMIPYLTTPKAIKDAESINESITNEEFIRRWQRSREYTSTG